MTTSNIEIEEFLFPLQFTKKKTPFIGVFSCDNIPTNQIVRKKQFAIICNLSKHDEEGSHFVTILCSNRTEIIYIDSFGFPPSNIYILKFLYASRRKLLFYNISCIQHPLSKACGYFCMFFVLYFQLVRKNNNNNMTSLKIFYKDLSNMMKNDNICKKLIFLIISANKR